MHLSHNSANCEVTFGEAYKDLDSKCRSGRNETTPDAARYQAIKSVVLR